LMHMLMEISFWGKTTETQAKYGIAFLIILSIIIYRKYCRLLMARDISYSVCQMFPLTDGAEYKLFGVKIFPHLLWWGFLSRRNMDIQSGFYYHIKDTFFNEVQDSALMTNKECGNYRPHYLAIQDSGNPQIYWMIPVSSKFEKYQKIYNNQIAKYKKCTKIVLGKCGGWDAAFLIQNAFPATADYFDHIHTSKGIPLVLHSSTAKLIAENLNYNLRLHKRGISLFYTDIDRIYNLMESKLKVKSN
ncbi:MAG: hypothetical protein NC433_17505, partial [Clostridiales bacterium]|nr:hypothetical protein [Clostridiales bacterium]